MGRRRKSQNSVLPPNLYQQRVGRKVYYRYRNPKTRKVTGFGADRRIAIATAIRANQKLLDADVQAEIHELVHRVVGTTETLSTFLHTFLNEIMPTLRTKHGHRHRPSTVTERTRMIGHIDRGLGAIPLNELTGAHIAKFLKKYPNVAANRYLTLISVILRHAVALGKIEAIPVSPLLKRHEKRRRIRLTLEGYLAIRRRASDWLRNAMDLSLLTLARREDVVKIRHTDIDDNHLRVIHTKVKGHGIAARVRMEIGPALAEVIARCRDRIDSPFLVHRDPEKRRTGESREHWSQVMPDMLTREFQYARDASGYYNDLPMFDDEGDPIAPPSFHEIKSLGVALYDAAKEEEKNRRQSPRTGASTKDNTQALAAHTTRDMTDRYREGHVVWSVRDVLTHIPDSATTEEEGWTDARANLSIDLSAGGKDKPR